MRLVSLAGDIRKKSGHLPMRLEFKDSATIEVKTNTKSARQVIKCETIEPFDAVIDYILFREMISVIKGDVVVLAILKNAGGPAISAQGEDLSSMKIIQTINSNWG
jgi:hypothetical protein